MKKINNKGFTLMELLIVIAVLALIVTFTIPIVMNVLDKTKNESITTYKNNLLSSTMLYIKEFDNEIYYQLVEGQKIACVSAKILKEKGYIKNDYIKYNDDDIDYNNSLIKIVKDSNDNVIETSFHDKKLTCYDSRGLAIDTSDLRKEYEVLETPYNFSDVKAYFGGEDISDLIKVVSSDSSLTIPSNNGTFNKIGEFSINYSIEYTFGGITESADSTVILNVKDTKKPSISLTGGSLITTIVVGSSYTDPGFEITDNYYNKITGNSSGNIGDFNVNVNSNVDVNKVGTYFVKYTATDSSGNTSSEVTRTINVVPTPITQYAYSDYVSESYTTTCPESYSYSCSESYSYSCSEPYTYSCTESYTGSCSSTCHSSMSVGSCYNSGGSCSSMSGSHCSSCSYSCTKPCTKTRNTTCSGTRSTTCTGTRSTTCSGTRYVDCTKSRNVWTAYGNWEETSYTKSSTRKVKKRVCSRDINYKIIESTCVVTEL